MRFEYVGRKAAEHALKERTGIVWAPGMQADVADDIGALMRRHDDVWREVETAPTRDAGLGLADVGVTVTSDGAIASGKTVDGEVSGRPDPLAAMSDEQVHAYAKERGIKVHHKLAGDNLRAKVREAR